MIDVENIALSYRKAKVDLYYSSNPSLRKICEYEKNIKVNILQLCDKINGDDESWVETSEFIGTWALAPKSVNISVKENPKNPQGNGLIFSSPKEKWEQTCSFLKENGISLEPNAEFRVMADCSIDFHVLSTLWMMKVGHLFDSKLTGCAYGNRLRRPQNGKGINPLSLGSFVPYLKPFRDWRDNGIKSMHTALDAKKEIIAITADVSSFYHELNPGFLLEKSFLEDILALNLQNEQIKLNRLFVKALQAWAAITPLRKGLPVGLPASAIVANVALLELDRVIERQVVPLYYGRYVDDILLVMENGAKFRSTAEPWEWLFSRSDGKLSWTNPEEKTEIAFQPAYFKKDTCKSKINFSNKKNKVFILSGETGKALVDAIDHQIHERASEWRGMPQFPRSASYVGTDLLAAIQSDGETADNLRKTDALTMRRAGFAIRLRDLEAYERDLLPDAWKDHRRAFFRAFIQHVLVLPHFFDLSIYFPRVIRLATICEDFCYLRKIIDALVYIYKEVKYHCSISIKAYSDSNKNIAKDDIINFWKRNLFTTIKESITAAFPPSLSKTGTKSWGEFMESYTPETESDNTGEWPLSAKDLKRDQALWFSFDLAHMPFRFIGLPTEMIAQRGIPVKKTVALCKEADDLLPNDVLNGVRQLARWLNFKGLPYGLLFATRPFNMAELYIVNKANYDKDGLEAMSAIVLALRGFTINDKMPFFDKNRVLQIPDGQTPKCNIAVSSWKTHLDSWSAAVTRLPDMDIDRYARLNRLLDTVIANPQNSRYLILPELALPARWFIRIARKLHARGISLITGIEYLHVGKSRVRNQVWASLSHIGLGFPSFMIYRQDKQHPALHEEIELQRMAGLEMKPDPDKTWKSPPIIQHGDFRFALLICSELTNISYRAALRGQIDALFVPEWNKDTETFNTLVESAALDIHAYVIQCNDRQYGDSRIRAPFKDNWKRDVLRIKGGITDYCVIGQIDVHALRQFQSSHRSPCKPFKPVPDGFIINYNRKTLPISE